MGSLHSTMFGDGSKCSNMFKSLHSASTRTTMGQIDLGMFQKSPAWLLSHSISLRISLIFWVEDFSHLCQEYVARQFHAIKDILR